MPHFRPSLARVLAGCLAAAVLAVPGAARAAEYELFIDIDDEEDLYDLQVTGQIEDETFETLVEILRRGVDLNTASRAELYALPNLTYDDVDAILAYRADVGFINDPASLVLAGVVSERKVAAIAAFLVIREPGRELAATNGLVRAQIAYAPSDTLAPPAVVQARLSTARHLTLGGALFHTRLRVGDVRWDPAREALSAEPIRSRVHAPKFFAQWDTDDWGVIAGTYRIGFGQRLTFDNSGRFTPNGFFFDDAVFRSTNLTRECRLSAGELDTSPCTGAAGDVYVTPDFRWRTGLRGVAAGFRHAELPKGWMQGYAWASYQNQSIYQYELSDAAACADPRNDDDPRCSAPDVFDRGDRAIADPLAPQARHSFQTLPEMYDEALGGANLSWFASRRAHVGITGYGAAPVWRVGGADLDFQEWSATPFGGPFGAIGADAAWGRKWSDVFVEVARSFDSMPQSELGPGGGGFAGLVRHTSTWDTHEIEVAARYYDAAYANPYARPIAAPDEFEGNRARDEAGARVRYNGLIADRVSFRALADVWAQPRERQPKLRGYLRADVQTVEWLTPGFWFDYQNRDLRNFARTNCYEVSVEFDENGEPIPCGGERMQFTPRVTLAPHRRVQITAQYRHGLVDDPAYDGRFRQDAAATLIVNTNPWRSLRLRLRSRYRFEDISDNTRLEQNLWSYLEASYRFAGWFSTRLRYDLVVWLDDRTATQTRSPSPEHWLRLTLEARF